MMAQIGMFICHHGAPMLHGSLTHQRFIGASCQTFKSINPAGSVWCMNAAPSSYLPGLHSYVMTTNGHRPLNHYAAFKGLNTKPKGSLYSSQCSPEVLYLSVLAVCWSLGVSGVFSLIGSNTIKSLSLSFSQVSVSFIVSTTTLGNEKQCPYFPKNSIFLLIILKQNRFHVMTWLIYTERSDMKVGLLIHRIVR